MNIKRIISLSVFLFITSCSIPMNDISNNPKILNNSSYKLNYEVTGQVNFPVNFSTKATQSDITVQSTISILYPSNHADSSLANTAVGAGLTDSKGSFKINPSQSFSPSIGDIFILEAQKRIGGEGNNILTLKTFIKWTSDGWISITGSNIYINTKTTALSIMSGYNPQILNPNLTISKINVVNGVSNLTSINSEIYSQKISEIDNLINMSLGDNQDPVSRITYSSGYLIYKNTKVFINSVSSGGSGGVGGGGGIISNPPSITSVSKGNDEGMAGISGDILTVSGTNLTGSQFTLSFYLGPDYQPIPVNKIDKSVSSVTNSGTTVTLVIPELNDNEVNTILGRSTSTAVTDADRKSIRGNITVVGPGGSATSAI